MTEERFTPENWEKRLYPPYDDPSYNKDGWHLTHWFGDKRHFRPWYDDDADYNTNSKSYYDYLGFRLVQFEDVLKAINQLLRRNVAVGETNTVKMTKEGDWQFQDVITLNAVAKLSSKTGNAIQALDDGLYTEDLRPYIDAGKGELQKQITELKTTLAKHDAVLRKLLESLKNNGSWNSNGDILDGNFNPGHGVASGNINLFGGTQDGGSFIRTNGGHTENDLTGGI